MFRIVRNSAANGAVALLLAASQSVVAQQVPVRISLDSVLNTQIQAASKYLQKSADAPASVTIITAEEIGQHGYRNLQEVLESVRGFYVSNDRNYAYLGIRGFSRPTDYNNRVLLLIDGHALNDQTWGGTPVGSDLPVNLQAVERIEIVRGPGSALYGTNAMFGVINIVTKTGAQLNGVRTSLSYGSGNFREASMAAGTAIGAQSAVAASMIITRSDGSDLTFPDLSNGIQDGVSRNQDWEESFGMLVSANTGVLGARGGFRTRSKGIPTGAYGTRLGDERARTRDETLWGEISLRRNADGALGIGARLFADRYQYRGVYPSVPGPAYSDAGGSTDIGAEVLGTWDPVSRNRLTFGTEYRNVVRAEYAETQQNGDKARDNAPFGLLSVFAENALQLTSSAEFVAGIRYEHHSRDRDAVAPRLALLLTPAQRTTLKVLYGQAYRSPSAAEADISTSYYTRNPALRPERISTAEIELQHHVARPVLLSASVFHYRLKDLIDPVESTDIGLDFRNRARAHAIGIEVQADVVPSAPVAATFVYAFQRARSEDPDQDLTNSPRHIASMSLRTGEGRQFRTATTLRYESERHTLQGERTAPFVRTDINVSYTISPVRSLLGARQMAFSLRVTNLFNTGYAVPGGLEHTQASLPQPGRVAALRADWRR